MRYLEIFGRCCMIAWGTSCLCHYITVRNDLPTVFYVAGLIGGTAAVLDLVINFVRK